LGSRLANAFSIDRSRTALGKFLLDVVAGVAEGSHNRIVEGLLPAHRGPPLGLGQMLNMDNGVVGSVAG
jgi:hypothetical protein